MKNLNAVALSVLLLPALSLGSTAFAAGDEYDTTQEGEQSEGDKGGGQQHAAGLEEGDQHNGEQHLSGKPEGALHADDLIGKTVKHRDSDEDIGEIQDLIIGDDGQILGVVVTTGGFLGLGGQDIGLGWDHLEHAQEDDESVFYVDMEEDALRDAPAYEKD